jgi:hypothetical protein
MCICIFLLAESFNDTFTSVLDMMRRRFLKPEKYKSGQAKKLETYHTQKRLKVGELILSGRLP